MTNERILSLSEENKKISALIDMLFDMFWDNLHEMAALGDQVSIDLIQMTEGDQSSSHLS